MKNAVIFCMALLVLPGFAAAQRSRPAPVETSDRPAIDVESYAVEITLMPAQNEVRAVAEIQFKQLERMSYVTFDLDNRLRVDRVSLNGSDVRSRQYDLDSTLEVTLPSGDVPEVATLRFEYAGFLDPQADKRAPVLSSVSDEGAFLLYESKWFPTNSLFKDKAAARIRVNAPEGWTVLCDLPSTDPGTFASQTPSYWGMIAAGKYTNAGEVKAGKTEVTTQTLTVKPEDVLPMAESAGKVLDFYEETFGPATGPRFNIIEVAGANWSSRWAPGALLLSPGQFRPDYDEPALARALSHQWFPLKVGVADPSRDAWMIDGLATFASLLYAEKNLSPSDAQDQIDKALVKALASEDAISIREAGKLDRETPEYRALVEYKGAYVFRMLRWVIGEEKFNDLIARYIERFQNTPASTDALTRLASDVSGQDLGYFFDQWLNDSGIPMMEAQYEVLRVRDGYRIDGDIKQDLDLFRMPVELEIETDGEPDYKRVDVSGSATEFSVTTERKPKSVNIDPRKRILRLSPDIEVAVKINRGEELMNDGRYNDAMDEFQDAIDLDADNSLASFRMGEALFELTNLNPAAQNFRNAIAGDLKPKWVEVWSYINLGKIYDIRGDRDRAVGEYQKAVSTGDDSYGAQQDAQKYIETPFRRGDR